MHYIGMSAVNLAGRLVWDERFVVASVAIGILLSAAAAAEHRRRPSLVPWRPALLFTLAICGLHFTAMAAAGIYPDPYLAVPAEAIGAGTLTIGVVAMAFLILSISFAMVLFDRKLARNAADEARRIRDFADAAIEGLVVIDGDRIVDANRSFLALAGYDERGDIAGRCWRRLFRASSRPDAPDEQRAVECRLIDSAGGERDVEVLPADGQLGRRGTARARGARHQRAQGSGGADRPSRLSRLADRPAQPRRLQRPSRPPRRQGRPNISEPLAVLCVDLDGFKAVNDIYGHPAGDELLIEVAQRLRSVTRGHELVARLGGDEFAVVQEGGSQPGHADLLAERIIAALRSPFTIGGQSVRISASIGVAVFPADAASAGRPDQECRHGALPRQGARAAASPASTRRRWTKRFASGGSSKPTCRTAIGNGELKVHYQPLAELESGAIIGFEALLRWDHPQHGPISPEMFIRLAEESGLIVKLGEWVLQRGLRRGGALDSAAQAVGQPVAAPVPPGRPGRARSSGCWRRPASIRRGSSSRLPKGC